MWISLAYNDKTTMKTLRLLLPVCLAVTPFLFAAEDPSPEHVKLMKEMGSLNGKLRKGEDVEASAKRMAELGATALVSWQKRSPEVGASSLKNLIVASNMVAAAAANKEADKVTDGLKMLGGACKSCHDAHREKVGEGEYKIK